jgi:hypothetical protein
MIAMKNKEHRPGRRAIRRSSSGDKITDMNSTGRFSTILIVVSMILSPGARAQTSAPTENQYNPITTAVPFLTITPDSRHGAMGDAGVATSPDANSQYWNPSQLAFAEQHAGVSLSFTPWLRRLFNDMNLAYLAGYTQLKGNQAIGASLRYFNVGEILLTDQNGSALATVRPNEFALDISYSRKLSEFVSGGVALRYIRSDLSGGIGPQAYVPGNAFSSDVSFYFHKTIGKDDNNQAVSAGINISNIGSRISYDNGSTREYLPANLKLGATWSDRLNDMNDIAVSVDFNKLLVPTPQPGASQADYSKPVISSVFSSLGDAPGGLKEELQEMSLSLGAEYWYSRKFAARLGYFNENAYKGNRKFFSTGVGVKMNICSVDVAYLVPVQQNNPLSNTVRFTLHFDLGIFRKSAAKPEEVSPAPAEQVP